MAGTGMRASIILTVTLLSVASIGASVGWWEDGTLYQVYPRSWKDSDGDGVGDLKGITEKLEYLKEIGVSGAWLSPIFRSPMADFGYDVSNFYEIDPIFGNMDDFDALIRKAKMLDIKIILDFVPNHSSDECEWFQKSVDRVEGYEDFYVWVDGVDDPANPGQKLVPNNWISLFGGTAWAWNEKRQQFYLHQFQVGQPDLNYRNENVRATMLDVLTFWLDRGADGFRIDAVPNFYENMNSDGSYPDEPLTGNTTNSSRYDYSYHIHTLDTTETIQLMYEWREFLDNYQKENGGGSRVMLAEAYSPIEALDLYFGNGTRLGAHVPFNFDMLLYLSAGSNARDVENVVNGWMDIMWTKHQTANWVLANHDNSRIGDRFGEHKIDLMNVLVGGLPGSTVVYYGDEIGMMDVPTECTPISCDSRDSERTPFQWNDQTSAGFSTSNSTWLPVADDYKKVNVKVQRGIERSTLNVFKGIQRLKRTAAFKAFKEPGAWSYGAISDQVFQIIREAGAEHYRILINLGDKLEAVGPLINSVNNNQNTVEYVLVTRYSPHRIGERADLNKIYLMAFEAVVLRRVVL